MAKEVAKVPVGLAKKQKIIEQMTPDLQKIYEKINKSWQAANKSDVLTRYDWGVMIAKIRGAARAETYGEGAVKQLAEALGCDPRNLYQFGDLATTFTRDDIVALLEQSAANGEQLSWSHFRTLSTISSDRIRKVCLDRCLKEALSVKELDELVRSKLEAARDTDAPVPARKVGVVLKQFVKLSQGITAKDEDFDKRLFDALDNISNDAINDSLLDSISEARDAMTDLENLVEKSQRRLATAEQRVLAVMRSKDALKAKQASKIKAKAEDDEDDEDEDDDEEELEEDLEEELDEDVEEDEDEDEDEEELEVDDEEDDEEELEAELDEEPAPKRKIVTRPRGA